MPVTERFVLVVVLVLEFVGAACWDIALRWYRALTRGQAPIVHRSVTPLHRLIEDEDDDENEYDSKILPNIPDLLQGISTLI
ncbi:MAG: hypothetical protein JO275_00050 [Verrucomicrobia bacterium]|nr:hypothetical protein [Verrucomicrobiota bacterium]